VPRQTLAMRPLFVATNARPGPNVGFTGSKGALIGVSETHGGGVIKLTALPYNYPFQIPTDLNVPCTGDGYFVLDAIPASPTARPAIIPVTFVPFTIHR
jgi:hypothetical protein